MWNIISTTLTKTWLKQKNLLWNIWNPMRTLYLTNQIREDRTSFLTKIIVVKALINYSIMAHTLHFTWPFHTRIKEYQIWYEIFSSDLLNSTKFHLSPFFSNCARFYALPKVHKPDIPFRPIIYNIGMASHCLAKFSS